MRFLIVLSVFVWVFAVVALIPAAIVWLILAAFGVNTSFWLVWGIATLIGLIIKA